MYYDETIRPGDIPPPPGLDEVTRRFPGPLFTLETQPAIEEASIGTGGGSTNGRPTHQEAVVSYTFWRNPNDHGDPVNGENLSEELAAQLDAEPVAPLPPWLLEARERMRYPMLWETVRTTAILNPAEGEWRTAGFVLVEHVNHVLMNAFHTERVIGGFPGVLSAPVTEMAIERHIPLRLDGEVVDGFRIDTDAHVLGVGIDLRDRYLTAVLSREYLPLLSLGFVTRKAA